MAEFSAVTRVWDQSIAPFCGIGRLRFGMSKADVRSLLGRPEKEFVRDPVFAPDRIEWIYDDGRAFVAFNGSGTCDEIMLCPPADPRLEGVRLLAAGAVEVWSAVRRLDRNAFVDGPGCLTSLLYGVNVHAPDVGTEFEEPDAAALSVLLFSDPDDERLRPQTRRKKQG